MSDSCVRCLVSGRVQGVWYRASTREQAHRLGLRGSARNLSDGRVEVVACGSEEAVAQMRQWLWEGSPMSQVSAVECAPLGEEGVPEGFTTA